MIAMKAIGIRLSGKAELAGITSGLFGVDTQQRGTLGHFRAIPELAMVTCVLAADRSQLA
jgi:hypothetical protein